MQRIQVPSPMSNPNRVLIWMSLFLFAVLSVAALLFEPLQRAFMANQVFNGMILLVLLVGVVVNFRQVMVLNIDATWIDTYTSEGERAAALLEPRLLGPLAKMLSRRNRKGFLMSAMTMRSVLDGVRVRLDESRDISRYLAGLLVFLGLLGTFWGLLDTIAGVVEVIGGLAPGQVQDPEASAVAVAFSALLAGLEGPLDGMGTAFSSSLFGLAGSLVVGFLDLQAGHAQNRFFNDMEDWLSELTHLPSGTIGAESERGLPSYLEALLEQTAENLDQLQRMLTQREEERASELAKQMELNERIAELTGQMNEGQRLIERVARSNADLQPVLVKLSDTLAREDWGSDEAMRGHLRSLDLAANRLLGEVTSGRQKLMDELRKELRLVAQTIAPRGHHRDRD
jgi:hypothetical protein